jgi:hypothetical protein
MGYAQPVYGGYGGGYSGMAVAGSAAAGFVGGMMLNEVRCAVLSRPSLLRIGAFGPRLVGSARSTVTRLPARLSGARFGASPRWLRGAPPLRQRRVLGGRQRWLRRRRWRRFCRGFVRDAIGGKRLKVRKTHCATVAAVGAAGPVDGCSSRFLLELVLYCNTVLCRLCACWICSLM